MSRPAVSQENVIVALLVPLARLPEPIADAGLRARPNHGHTDIVTVLIRALVARYPVVRRLLGNDSFLGVARRFVASEPPRLPVLVYFEQNFLRYLRSPGDAASLEYIADIAELEAVPRGGCRRLRRTPALWNGDARRDSLALR